ncbi:hypothetical protein XBJ2_1230028 [Xenorhabdus bovienii str. Jollieti]|uniref:Uncharacterized protein n=1 Tax=Xenorhabdus bovienii (strain SS-2004) TaxID=406818 RepID=D3V170_XENBS|nr:hypothetical protein XBJ1_2217 [Xenorhabdus bovienii SS-2004]CDH27134.1 hypothetical protein XBJ2_1230028 [Xenorhabdus bovienii str. Jollieti]
MPSPDVCLEKFWIIYLLLKLLPITHDKKISSITLYLKEEIRVRIIRTLYLFSHISMVRNVVGFTST